jgi:hypothetical protein
VNIDADLKNDLTNGIDYLKGFVERVATAAPGWISEAEKAATSPIAQALESTVLGADDEAMIARLITKVGTAATTAADEAAQAVAPSEPTAPDPSTPADTGSVPAQPAPAPAAS